MLTRTKSLMIATSMVALLSPAALAGEPAAYTNTQSHVVLDQVQLGNVWSELDVVIDTHATDAVAANSAVGNAAAGLIMMGDIDLDVTQSLHGDVGANTTLSGGDAETAVAATTAYGNSTTGGTWAGDNHYRADQISNGDIEATTDIDLHTVGVLSSSTTAIANVSVPSDEFGKNAVFQTQTSNGSVLAHSDANLCCANDTAAVVTVAGANSVSSNGTSSENINGAVQTTAAGESVTGVTDVYAYGANNVIAATTSSGNAINVHNAYGPASLGVEGSEVYQSNESFIDSQTYVTLTHFNGQAASTAYGVGNSSLISNVGADTGMNAIQNNYGDVYTSANFNGTSTTGGTAIVNSTSIGNAATATLCNLCGDATLQGGVIQHNGGNVIATGRINTPYAGAVHGSASAVGNSATFQSNGD